MPRVSDNKTMLVMSLYVFICRYPGKKADMRMRLILNIHYRCHFNLEEQNQIAVTIRTQFVQGQRVCVCVFVCNINNITGQQNQQ